MYTRRNFLYQLFSGAAGFTLYTSFPDRLFSNNSFAEDLFRKEFIKLTILHTNDMHSRIDPFPMNDPSYPGLGGMARRAALIGKIRSEEKNVLLFDAGDVFQGTPYFNLFGGEVEFKLMSSMKYDGCTIGNHDFDNGLDGLMNMLPHATFPFINSNYDFSDTVMNGKTIPHKIFLKEGIRVGVFGLGIELSGLVEKKLSGNTKYLDPLKKAEEVAGFLKNDAKCDFVICLSHLGYKYEADKVSDMVLAKQTSNIDLVIGGHTHTFLNAPEIVKNRMNTDVLINQVGWAGIRLGKIDVFFQRGKSKKIFSRANFFTLNRD